ncbi:MAG: hypothetical protein FWB90_04590 [Fibromonadales bacterium]|nr:hypothetical protein [Fibromonadales bacterium]
MAEWAAIGGDVWSIALGNDPWIIGADLKAIRKNILGWGLASEVPVFEKYVYDYWVKFFKLGECNTEVEWSVKRIAAIDETSRTWVHLGHICRNGVWELAALEDIRANEYCLENHCEIFIDNRDGKKYRTRAEGTLNQTWIIEPLRYRGEAGNLAMVIPWIGLGLIYTSLENALAACPVNWHLPNVNETKAIMPEECVLNPEDYTIAWYPHDMFFDNNIIFWGNTEMQGFFCYDNKVSFNQAYGNSVVYCVKD